MARASPSVPSIVHSALCVNLAKAGENRLFEIRSADRVTTRVLAGPLRTTEKCHCGRRPEASPYQGRHRQPAVRPVRVAHYLRMERRLVVDVMSVDAESGSKKISRIAYSIDDVVYDKQFSKGLTIGEAPIEA